MLNNILHWFKNKPISYITFNIYNDPIFSSFYQEMTKLSDNYLSDEVKDIDILKDILKNKNVLEIGTGNGRVLIPLSKSGIEIIGIEPEFEMIKFIPEIYKDKVTMGDMLSVLKDNKFVSKARQYSINTIIIPATTVSLFNPDDVSYFINTWKYLLKTSPILIFDFNLVNLFDNKLHYNNTNGGKFYSANELYGNKIIYNIYHDGILGVSVKYKYDGKVIDEIAKKTGYKVQIIKKTDNYCMIRMVPNEE